MAAAGLPGIEFPAPSHNKQKKKKKKVDKLTK
jgi:hypothetical protein